MHIFIDESGAFKVPSVPASKTSCVAALLVADDVVDEMSAEFLALRRGWPGGETELKGSSLGEQQIDQCIQLCSRFDPLLRIVACDTGLHRLSDVETIRTRQARGIRRAVGDDHQPKLVNEVLDVAARWERLSAPLVIQLYATAELVMQALATGPTYYAQRKPKELAAFCWVHDRKDVELTPYEKLWTELVCPFVQDWSLDRPWPHVTGHAQFDYSGLDRFYVQPETMGRFARDPEVRERLQRFKGPARAMNLNMIMRESATFDDSESIPGLQIIDILASAFTRAMNGSLQKSGWANLGRLMILERDAPPAVFLRVCPEGTPRASMTPFQIHVSMEMERRLKSMMVAYD